MTDVAELVKPARVNIKEISTSIPKDLPMDFQYDPTEMLDDSQLQDVIGWRKDDYQKFFNEVVSNPIWPTIETLANVKTLRPDLLGDFRMTEEEFERAMNQGLQGKTANFQVHQWFALRILDPSIYDAMMNKDVKNELVSQCLSPLPFSDVAGNVEELARIRLLFPDVEIPRYGWLRFLTNRLTDIKNNYEQALDPYLHHELAPQVLPWLDPVIHYTSSLASTKIMYPEIFDKVSASKDKEPLEAVAKIVNQALTSINSHTSGMRLAMNLGMISADQIYFDDKGLQLKFKKIGSPEEIQAPPIPVPKKY